MERTGCILVFGGLEDVSRWGRIRLGAASRLDRALCGALLLLVLPPLGAGAQLIYAVGAGSRPASLPNIEGGYLTDSVNGIAVDRQGYVYLTGDTFSPDFPKGLVIPTGGMLGGARRRLFVAKLSPDGSRFLYVKVIEGGSGKAIAVDATGNAYVAGTANPGYGRLGPEVPVSLRAGPLGAEDAFALKLDPSGSRVLYTAYLGGSYANGVNALALDGAGNVYVAGTTWSRDYPFTPGAFQSVSTCDKTTPCGFVSKLNASGTTLVYSARLGGSSVNLASSIAVDASGAVYVTGSTSSLDFPVTAGAFQRQHSGSSAGYPYDAFVTKLNPSGTAAVYSTYLGGSLEDWATGVIVDASGNAYVAGTTRSDDFPVTPQAFQKTTHPNLETAFVAKLNATGTALVYSTFLGSTLFGNTRANAIALDAQGSAYITGSTYGGLPVWRAFQPSFYGGTCASYSVSGTFPTGFWACSDAFVAALNASGSGLLYSTYLNGYLNDSGLAIAVDSQGNTYAAGHGALSLAATNPLSNDGGAFAVKLSSAGTPPLFTRESITNGANFVSGLVLPGGLATIFCANLTGIRGIVQAPGFPLPTELAGVRVKINGILAPLLAVADVSGQQQINLQVPFEAASTADPLDVEVSQNGISAWVIQVKTKSTAPGIFTVDGTYGAIQHGADYSAVTPASPAQRREVVVLYGTGTGWVTPAVPSGMPAPMAPLAVTKTTPTVTIGGNPAEVLFSGLVPGFVTLYQLNVSVPDAVASGDQDVVVSFPPYQECCLVGVSLRTVRVDSRPVKIPVR